MLEALSLVSDRIMELLLEEQEVPLDLIHTTIREATPPLLAVLPGSRRSEIERLMPVFGQTLSRLAARIGPFEVELPAVGQLVPNAPAAGEGSGLLNLDQPEQR